MCDAENTRKNLNLYLAFLAREADVVRMVLGYDQLDGVLTPRFGCINQLYQRDIVPKVIARSQQILTTLNQKP